MSQLSTGIRRRVGASTLAFVMMAAMTMPLARATETPPSGEEFFEEEESMAIDPTAPLPTHDPFFALIQPKKEPVIEEVIDVQVKPPTFVPPPAPVQYSVLAIAGETDEHTAVIQYKNETYVVQAGAKIPDNENPEFEIKEVAADKVTAWDPRVKRIVPVRLPQLATAVPGAGP